jgi:hypothetical protein
LNPIEEKMEQGDPEGKGVFKGCETKIRKSRTQRANTRTIASQLYRESIIHRQKPNLKIKASLSKLY